MKRHFGKLVDGLGRFRGNGRALSLFYQEILWYWWRALRPTLVLRLLGWRATDCCDACEPAVALRIGPLQPLACLVADLEHQLEGAGDSEHHGRYCQLEFPEPTLTTTSCS